MASKRVVKCSVDWAELAKRVPPTQKANLVAFKAKSDGYLRKVMANPEEPPKIDWSYYKTNAANKALVEQFEKAYNALKIPYPSDKGALSAVLAEEKAAMADVKEFVRLSNERIKLWEKEIEIIKNTMPLEEMSNEEFALAYPKKALDPLNKPTNYPHDEQSQNTPEDIEWFRKINIYHPGPDRYYK